ncbi:MAG: hypothetical protein JST55_14815 [Bacteroidetes bacterium]|nr:hypothetical protein [Bacteroidota bacterium]
MKIFLALFILILTSSIFYSCKSDEIISPGPASGFAWSTVATVNFEDFHNIYAADENTVVALGQSASYKITNGARSTINFNDPIFSADYADTYSSTYFAFCGTRYNETGSGTIRMKIYESGTITSAVLDTHNTSYIVDIKIISPGKIAAVSYSKFYFYENGAVTAIASPDSFSTGFNNIVVTNNVIYISGAARKIYKFENNTLSTVDNLPGTGEYTRMKVPDAIIKAPYSPSPSVVSYWNGAAWSQMFTDNSRKIFVRAAGESINFIYFFTVDSTLSNVSGKIWTGSQLMDDTNYPPDDIENGIYTTAVSNMRGNTVFISKYGSSKSTIYRGRKNF